MNGNTARLLTNLGIASRRDQGFDIDFSHIRVIFAFAKGVK